MNFWAKIGLSALALASVGGLLYWDEYATKQEAEQKKSEGLVLNFTSADVIKFEITSEKGMFSFERTETSNPWVMKNPDRGVRPDQDTINNLLSSLQNLKQEGALENTEPSDAYGFENPKVNVTLMLKDNSRKSLTIGNDLSIGSNTGGNFVALSSYARSSDKQATLVIPSSMVTNLTKGFSDYRTKIPATFASNDVRKIILTKNNGTSVTLEKIESDWHIKSPKQVTADNNNVTLFLDRISRMRATKVVEPEDISEPKSREYGLNQPAATIELYGAENQDLQKIIIGLSTSNMYVRMTDGAVAYFDIDRFVDTAPDLKFFRDRRVLRGMILADVTRIKTKSGKVYERDGTAWYRSPIDPKNKKEVSAADEFFSDWEYMAAEEIIDEAKNLADFGLDKPLTTFELINKNEDQNELILIGSRVLNDEKKAYAKRAGKPEVYVVETGWMDRLTELDSEPTPAAETDNTNEVQMLNGETPQAQK